MFLWNVGVGLETAARARRPRCPLCFTRVCPSGSTPDERDWRKPEFGPVRDPMQLRQMSGRFIIAGVSVTVEETALLLDLSNSVTAAAPEARAPARDRLPFESSWSSALS